MVSKLEMRTFHISIFFHVINITKQNFLYSYALSNLVEIVCTWKSLFDHKFGIFIQKLRWNSDCLTYGSLDYLVYSSYLKLISLNTTFTKNIYFSTFKIDLELHIQNNIHICLNLFKTWCVAIPRSTHHKLLAISLIVQEAHSHICLLL